MAREITTNGYRALDAFAKASQELKNDGESVLRLTSTGKVSTGGHYVKANVFRRIGRDIEGNNRTREALLRSLGEAYGLQGMNRTEDGRTTFSKDFMREVTGLIGADLSVDDFKVGDDGFVSSGKPLTARRVAQILGKIKRDLEKRESARLLKGFVDLVKMRVPGYEPSPEDQAKFLKDCLDYGGVENGLIQWCKNRPCQDTLTRFLKEAKTGSPIFRCQLEDLQKGFREYVAARRVIASPGFRDLSEASFETLFAKECEALLSFADASMGFGGENMYSNYCPFVEQFTKDVKNAVKTGVFTRKGALELMQLFTAPLEKNFNIDFHKVSDRDAWFRFKSGHLANIAAAFNGYASGGLTADKLREMLADCREKMLGGVYKEEVAEKFAVQDLRQSEQGDSVVVDIVENLEQKEQDGFVVVDVTEEAKLRMVHQHQQANAAKEHAAFGDKIAARIRAEQRESARQAAGQVAGQAAVNEPPSELMRVGVKFDAVYRVLKDRLAQMGIDLGEDAKLTSYDGRLKLHFGKQVQIMKYADRHSKAMNGMLKVLGQCQNSLNDAELDVKMSVEPDGKLRFGLLVNSPNIQFLVDTLRGLARSYVENLADDPLSAHPHFIGKEQAREVDGEDKQKWLDAEAKRKEAQRKAEAEKPKQAEKPSLFGSFLRGWLGGGKEEAKPAEPQVPEEFLALKLDPSELFADLKATTGVGLSMHEVRIGPEGLVCSIGSGQAQNAGHVGPVGKENEALAAELSLEGLGNQVTTAMKTLGLPLAPNGSVVLSNGGNGRLKVRVQNLDKRELVGLAAGFGVASKIAQALLGNSMNSVELELVPFFNRKKRRLELHFINGKAEGTIGQLLLDFLVSKVPDTYCNKVSTELRAAVKGADLLVPGADSPMKVGGSRFALTFDMDAHLSEAMRGLVPTMDVDLKDGVLRFLVSKEAMWVDDFVDPVFDADVAALKKAEMV